MTTLSLEEKIWINNGQCHMAHQNSAMEENQRGKRHVTSWKLKKGTHTHTFLPTDVGVVMSGTNLFQAQNWSI